MGRCGEYNLHERVYSGIGGPPKAQQEAREQALSGYENKKKQQLKKILYPIISKKVLEGEVSGPSPSRARGSVRWDSNLRIATIHPYNIEIDLDELISEKRIMGDIERREISLLAEEVLSVVTYSRTNNLKYFEIIAYILKLQDDMVQ
jgi:predicted nucleotidyltransferase